MLEDILIINGQEVYYKYDGMITIEIRKDIKANIINGETEGYISGFQWILIQKGVLYNGF